MKKRISVVLTAFLVLQIFLTPMIAYGEEKVITFTGSEPEKIGDWIYYNKNTYNYSLFKMGGGQKDSLVMEEYSNYSLPLGDRIYYMDPKDNDKIYSMKQDGTDRRQFLNESVYLYYGYGNTLLVRDLNGNFKLVDTKTGKSVSALAPEYFVMGMTEDYIYYRMNEYLYKCRLDGTRPTKISGFENVEKTVCTFYKDQVYYSQDNKFYSYNVNTKKAKKLYNKAIYTAQVVGGNLFFKDPDDYKVYMLNGNGKTRKLILSEDVWFAAGYDKNVYFNGYHSAYKVTPDGKKVTKLSSDNNLAFATKYGAYYAVANESYGFAKMKPDGSEETILINKRMYNAQLKNDVLYYANSDGLYSASLNGENEAKLFNGYIYDFSVKDNWIYLNYDGYLYNMTLQGKVNAKTKIGTYATLVGTDVYFLGYESASLYKVPMSGGTPELVDGNPCSDLYVNGSLYYVSQGKLMKIAAGENKGTYVVDIPDFMGFSGEFAKYYNNDLMAYYVVKLDGSGKAEYKYVDTLVVNMDGYDYYVNPEDNNYLYKKKLDGTDNKLVLKESDIYYAYVKNGVTLARKGGDIIYFVFGDGTTKQAALKNCSIYSVKIIGDYVYYQTYGLDSSESKVYKLY